MHDLHKRMVNRSLEKCSTLLLLIQWVATKNGLIYICKTKILNSSLFFSRQSIPNLVTSLNLPLHCSKCPHFCSRFRNYYYSCSRYGCYALRCRMRRLLCHKRHVHPGHALRSTVSRSSDAFSILRLTLREKERRK